MEKHKEMEEQRYLDLVRRVLDRGRDRDGKTLSLFGEQLRFSLADMTVPLLTTRYVWFKGILEELLWFVRGDTDAKNLSAKGVRIWDANGSRAYLDARGLHDREEGDLGPIYSHQWRHFGAEYVDCRTDYSGRGVDQLAQIAHLIRTDPYSRRIILSAWNPQALDAMALPPCHVLAQFYVDPIRRTLSCHLYQRSADIGLGLPFNMGSYALLTHMLAHVTDLQADELVISLGDAHIYAQHVETLRDRLLAERGAPTHDFPKLKWARSDIRSLDDFCASDFVLCDYNHRGRLDMPLIV